MGRISAKFVRACNVRSLIILVTVWLMFDPAIPQIARNLMHQFERSVLRVGLHFSDLPLVKTDISIIHVPSVEYDQWQADLPGASRLLELFTLLSGEKQQAITGLILENPLTLTQPEAEHILAEIQKGRRTKDHLFNEANEVLARREQLVTLLNAETTVLGLPGAYAIQYNSVKSEPGFWSKLSPMLPQWLWRSPPERPPSLLSPVLNYSIIPAAESGGQTLLVQNDNQLVASFWVSFLNVHFARASSQEGKSAPLVWNPGRGLKVQNTLVRAATDSRFIPLYGPLSGIRAPLRQISLGAALANGELGGWVLVGRDGSLELENAAQVLASLSSEAYLASPYWWSLSEKVIIVALFLFVSFAIPRMSARWVFIAVPSLAGLLVAMQVWGAVFHRMWLPSGLSMFYFLLVFSAIIIWRWQRHYLDGLVRRADRASMSLSESMMIGGQLKQALSFTKECRDSPELYERLYQIATRLEERQDWAQAIEVWGELRRRKRRYKDASARFKNAKTQHNAAQQASEIRQAETSETQALDQTHALSTQPVASDSTKFGRYEVKKEIGRGASGTVFLGFDPLISRKVAIKTIQYERFAQSEQEEVKARFLREAEAAGRLNHPNIVPVFDMGEEGGSAYIAMDFAKGEPLSHFIHTDHLLPIFNVYRITLEVADALAYAHEQKIVHRDIKPGNILYCSEPFTVRITDFGIARLVDHSHTRTGEILGSPLYMSPEQILGHKVEFGSDIFSLGVMFYQLLTGVLPFSGDSLATVSYEIVHCKHKSARSIRKELPASATRITNVCLQKKPQERYQSAAELAEALRKAIRRDFAADLKSSGIQI